MKAAFLLLTSWMALSAATLTYTEQTIATGSLGGTAFTNALVTLSLTGNTAAITEPLTNVFAIVDPATVAIGGLGTASFTDQIQVVDNETVGVAGFGDISAGFAIQATNNAAFATYNLGTAIGPVSGSTTFNSGQSFATDRGAFILTSVGGSTFTASAASVPEPVEAAPAALTLGAVLVLAGMRRKAVTLP